MTLRKQTKQWGSPRQASVPLVRRNELGFWRFKQFRQQYPTGGGRE